MKIQLKTKIRYNGQEYASPNDLPPAVRAAYLKAVKAATVSKITINGQQFASEAEMPAGLRNVYEDAVNLLQNNGEVTLPAAPSSEAAT